MKGFILARPGRIFEQVEAGGGLEKAGGDGGGNDDGKLGIGRAGLDAPEVSMGTGERDGRGVCSTTEQLAGGAAAEVVGLR